MGSKIDKGDREYKVLVTQKNKEQLLSMNLNKNSVFIDGGAHKGEELQVLSEIGCEVHSFEVNPVHCENLKKLYSENKNITINHAALWIKNDYIDVYYKKSSKLASMSTEKVKHNIDTKQKISVRAIDIADYILYYLDKEIDVMKLDIEGGEYKVIKHLIETGAIDKVKKIYFEDHEIKMLQEDLGWRREKKEVKKLMTKYQSKFKTWF